MKKVIKGAFKMYIGGRSFSVQETANLKTEYTVLKAQNLRGREVSDIRNGARMVSEILERSTEP